MTSPTDVNQYACLLLADILLLLPDGDARRPVTDKSLDALNAVHTPRVYNHPLMTMTMDDDIVYLVEPFSISRNSAHKHIHTCSRTDTY